MTTLNIATEPLKRLPDITEVEPFNEKDKPVFDEIIQILRKHNALDRFGLSLLHQHFDVSDDEVLIENTDEETRTQTIKPIKIKEVDAAQTIETSWRLDTGKPVMSCICIKMSGHSHQHRPSDKRLKNSVIKLKAGINEVMQLNPVTYFYNENNDFIQLSKDKQLGLIAQEVECLIPEVVKQTNDFKSIDYVSLIPVLIKAIQDQQKVITEMKEEISELRAVTA